MIIESNLKCGRYTDKEVIRIYNRDQQIFYVDSGVYPIDIYTSYAPKNNRKIIVMIFNRNDTKEVYQKWRDYQSEQITGNVKENTEVD